MRATKLILVLAVTLTCLVSGLVILAQEQIKRMVIAAAPAELGNPGFYKIWIPEDQAPQGTGCDWQSSSNGTAVRHADLAPARGAEADWWNTWERSPENLSLLQECYPARTWEELLQAQLKNVQKNAPWPERQVSGYTVQAFIAHGFLATDFVPELSYEGLSRYSFRKMGLERVAENETLRNLLLDWAMPYIKETFASLPANAQTAAMMALMHGQNYLANFPYQQEVAYLERLQRENQLASFTGKSPDGQRNIYRKLEAFFFRRAHYDGVKPVVMRQVLSRMYNELFPLYSG